jgi:hypothetical protein
MTGEQHRGAIRALSQLYARFSELQDGELEVWMEYVQRRFNLTASELRDLCDLSVQLGEWAERKIRALTESSPTSLP